MKVNLRWSPPGHLARSNPALKVDPHLLNLSRETVSVHRKIQYLEQLLALSHLAQRLRRPPRARCHGFVEIRIALIEIEANFPGSACLAMVSAFHPLPTLGIAAAGHILLNFAPVIRGITVRQVA